MSYTYRHPGPHTCSFRTAEFNDLLKQNNKIPKYTNVIIKIFLIWCQHGFYTYREHGLILLISQGKCFGYINRKSSCMSSGC